MMHMAPAAPSLLRFDRVSKRFAEAHVLTEVTLDIAKGTFVALVGGSGAGKSTLLRLANGLLFPDGGSILIEGRLLERNELVAARRQAGFVFQAIGLFPHMTVGENIAIGPLVAGRQADDGLVTRMLELVELPSAFSSRYPSELSGGQQQRVGIARALAVSPRLLLLDEPFAALDPVTRNALGIRMQDLHRELGLTTILVTHDMVEALLLGDRILVMEGGRIAADEIPSDLLAGRGGAAAQALLDVHRQQVSRLEGRSK